MTNNFFTNRDQQKLLFELRKEMNHCDEVNLIFPFISKGLLNQLSESFETCFQNQIPIKIITTTFDDQASFNNFYELEKLLKKYNNISIHVEDNFEKRSERIHIKASIFKRKNKPSSVLIGSSNLTIKGMVSGREWNVRLTESHDFDLIEQMIEEFNFLWTDHLVDFNDQVSRDQLLEKIKSAQIKQFSFQPVKKTLYDFQKKVIERLEYRRFQNKHKHLVIMATGTGKTVVAAFDYLNQVKKANTDLKLLFVAHQKEIIDQALTTFRQVLNQPDFGVQLYDGKTDIKDKSHVFATVQTLVNRLDLFEPNQFDCLIFDEAHHLAANSFDKVFSYFNPDQVLGLTATPEREDGQSIKAYFDDEFATEIRIWDAIDQKLLVPFDYYCIDDSQTDLTGVDLTNDKELFKHLNTTSRNELLYSMIDRYIGIYAHPIALIFCVTTAHAKIVATYLKSKNLRSAYLTSENSTQRETILAEFKAGRINYLCVVNMFNEGIDVPEINTIILLRPTNSKTVYLQQLGRGLRKTALKSRLEVYDLISNLDQRYDLTIGIKTLLNPMINFKDFFENQQGLPSGSTLFLEKQSEKLILQNIKSWYEDKNRIKSHVYHYYQQYHQDSLAKLLNDYELDLLTFYDHLNDFVVKVGNNITSFALNQNDLHRNKNLLKQFIFLDNYQVVNYFYLRLTKQLSTSQINWDLDNLLMTSVLYEITSLEKFNQLYPNSLEINDFVVDFMDHNQLIVEELIMILKYKLDYETLKVGNSNLLVNCTYTVKQVLSLLNRTNFLHYRGPVVVLTFQAGYLTFNNTTQIILADEDGTGYGKHTHFEPETQQFYWSLPEKFNLQHKIIADFQSKAIKTYLFLQNKHNFGYKNMFLKLYQYLGIGDYEQIFGNDELTVNFKVKPIETKKA